MLTFMWEWHNKRKSTYERIRQITFRVSWVPKQWTGIFKMSNTCTISFNNMVEEKAGVKMQNSKKEFEKNEHAYIVEGVLEFRIFLPVRYLKVAGPTRKIQSSSKLRQFQKWRAEIQDTPLGLTGIGRQMLAKSYKRLSKSCAPRSCKVISSPKINRSAASNSMQVEVLPQSLWSHDWILFPLF